MRIRMTEVVQKSLLMAIAFAKMGHHEIKNLTKHQGTGLIDIVLTDFVVDFYEAALTTNRVRT